MNESKAARYQRLRRRAHAAGIAAGGLMLLLMTLTPVARGLAEWSGGVGRGLTGAARGGLALAAFVSLTVVLWELVALPAVLYVGLRVDRRFRNADHTVESVLGAQAQATLVALPSALLAAAVVVISVRVAGGWWSLLAGGLLAAAVAGALRAAPMLVALVAGARPLDRPTLALRLSALARAAHVSVDRVHQFDVEASGPTTALVTGFGRTRRVFVSSEMVREWSHDEIAVVVAHELAHLVYHDLWRTLALDTAVLAAALGLAGAAVEWVAPVVGAGRPGDLTSLPLLALVAGVIWAAATPVRHAQSRAHERRADRFALALTGNAEAFAAAIRRLSARHLADDRPGWFVRWLYSRHPPVPDRLAAAEAFARAEEATSSGRR